MIMGRAGFYSVITFKRHARSHIHTQKKQRKETTLVLAGLICMCTHPLDVEQQQQQHKGRKIMKESKIGCLWLVSFSCLRWFKKMNKRTNAYTAFFFLLSFSYSTSPFHSSHPTSTNPAHLPTPTNNHPCDTLRPGCIPT